uniref:Uncharacterized protein n=1 Tax=Eutreptiella gymnastica TaxID=73025 RepID=A0A7S4LFH1_9EUGL
MHQTKQAGFVQDSLRCKTFKTDDGHAMAGDGWATLVCNTVNSHFTIASTNGKSLGLGHGRFDGKHWPQWRLLSRNNKTTKKKRRGCPLKAGRDKTQEVTSEVPVATFPPVADALWAGMH